jgi:hypothetical protein
MDGGRGFQPLPDDGRQPDAELAGDLAGDVALDREDVGQPAVVGLGPELTVGPGVDELPDDADLVPRTADASLEDGRGPEFLPDLPEALFRSLIRHHRGPRNDLQAPDLGKLGNDILRDAVAEIFVLAAVAHVLEREDGDGLVPEPGGRSGRPEDDERYGYQRRRQADAVDGDFSPPMRTSDGRAEDPALQEPRGKPAQQNSQEAVEDLRRKIVFAGKQVGRAEERQGGGEIDRQALKDPAGPQLPKKENSLFVHAGNISPTARPCQAAESRIAKLI